MNGSISSSPKPARIPLALNNDVLDELPIGGITSFTTIDFPGKLAAVLYTQGCPWRCRYCHNTHLWPLRNSDNQITWEKVRSFLEERKDLLDGVVFCGGEPTMHAGLGAAMTAVREMGFEIALHTNGMYPERLHEVLPLCDWVGMDIKTTFDQYPSITQIEDSGAKPRESARLIIDSGVDYEFRTTVHPDLLSEAAIAKIGKELSHMGARHYALQIFKSQGCPDKKLTQRTVSPSGISKSLRDTLSSYFASFRVR